MNSKVAKAFKISAKFAVAGMYAFIILFNISIIGGEDGWSVQFIKSIYALPVPCIEGSPDWPDCQYGGGPGGGGEDPSNCSTWTIMSQWTAWCYRSQAIQITISVGRARQLGVSIPGWLSLEQRTDDSFTFSTTVICAQYLKTQEIFVRK